MNDRLGLGCPEGCKNCGPVRQVSDEQRRPGIDRGSVTFGKIVKNGHRKSGIQQFFNADRANVAGTTGYEHIHIWKFLRVRFENSSQDCLFPSSSGGVVRCSLNRRLPAFNPSGCYGAIVALLIQPQRQRRDLIPAWGNAPWCGAAKLTE